MGGAFGTYGEERNMSFIKKTWCNDHLEDLGVDGRIILK